MKWENKFDYLFYYVDGDYKPFWVNGCGVDPLNPVDNWIQEKPLRINRDYQNHYHYRVKITIEIEEIKLTDLPKDYEEKLA